MPDRTSLRVPLTRRDALHLAATGVSACSLTGWFPVLAAREGNTDPKAKARACIVLWMDGGPPHTDTFDMKPDVPECGIYKTIPTAVTGIRITELLPKFADQMKHAAIVRGMSTVENEHLRA